MNTFERTLLERAAEKPILEGIDLSKHFAVESGLFQPKKPPVQAVNQVSLSVRKGETLALVGESGSGKSTLGRLLLNLLQPTAGDVIYKGRNLANLPAGQTASGSPRASDHFSGPVRLAEPAHDGGIHRRRADLAAQRVPVAATVRQGSPNCCARWAWPRNMAVATPTNSPAGNVSASASPVPWLPNPA